MEAMPSHAEQLSYSIVLAGVCRPFFAQFEERITISAHLTEFGLHGRLCLKYLFLPHFYSAPQGFLKELFY